MAGIVKTCRTLSLLLAAIAPGCAELSHRNEQLSHRNEQLGSASAQVRATFKVDAKRGNERVLFFLALSGGGSRAAYLSAATMLRLQQVFPDVDLLREVDVISSVSGGSLPGAYYAASRDASLPLRGALAGLGSGEPWAAVSPKLTVSGAALRCEGALTVPEQDRLRAWIGERGGAYRQVLELCAQSRLDRLRRWDAADVRERMTRNYVVRWIGNWFWPNNILLYWFTAYDRSDIMAKTFEDNLYDTPIIGLPLVFGDLNPARPYLIVNSTSATEQNRADGFLPETYGFGSVFTFTDDDFRQRLHSDILKYPIANAVMASSAFPLVFQNVTLRDFRPQTLEPCRDAVLKEEHRKMCWPLYLHVFDGGNSDNLGLRSVKRAIFEMLLAGRLDARRDKIVVMLLDAFTTPTGARRSAYDPRGFGSFFVDFNLLDAIDSLLQANRQRIIGEFANARLEWRSGDCRPDSQNLDPETCAKLEQRFGTEGEVNMGDSLLFYHFGFDDVKDDALRAKLNAISTSFAIGDGEAARIDEAVNLVLGPGNECLEQIRLVALDADPGIRVARAACARTDVLPGTRGSR